MQREIEIQFCKCRHALFFLVCLQANAFATPKSNCDLIISQNLPLEAVQSSAKASIEFFGNGSMAVRNSNYTQVRSSREYRAAFDDLSITQAKPNEVVMDLGGGFGLAIKHILQKHTADQSPKSVLVTYFEPGGETDLSLQDLEKLHKERLRVFSNQFFENISAEALIENFGLFDRINDYFGVMAYTTNPVEDLRKVHAILKPNATFSIVIEQPPTPGGVSPSLYTDQIQDATYTSLISRIMNLRPVGIENAFRILKAKQTNLVEWIIQNTSGFDFELSQSNPKTFKPEVLTLRKNSQPFQSKDLVFVDSEMNNGSIRRIFRQQ